MEEDFVVDLSFQLRGTSIPADHGYLLYSAISRQLPWVHGHGAVGIHPVRGQLNGQRQLVLTQLSRLILRLPATKIREAIPLAGRRLGLNGASVMVGVPTVWSMRPHSELLSRLVIIRGFTEATSFLEAAQRQLAQLGIDGSASLVQRSRKRPLEGLAGGREGQVRRTLRIGDKEVVGFAVQVNKLGARDSLMLQAAGLGGRRRFGCGIFLPSRERTR